MFCDDDMICDEEDDDGDGADREGGASESDVNASRAGGRILSK